jgi:hypothetical protein
MSKLSRRAQDVYKLQLAQSMLRDYFKFKVYHVTRDSQGWQLFVVKQGPRNMSQVANNLDPLPIPYDLNHIRWHPVPISMVGGSTRQLDQYGVGAESSRMA